MSFESCVLPSVVNSFQTGPVLFLGATSAHQNTGCAKRGVSKSGPPALLDDAQDGAIEAILATARSPRERDRRGMVDIALVLALRDCGLRRSEAAATRLVRHRTLGRRQRPSAHRAEPEAFRPARARWCSSPSGPLPPRKSSGISGITAVMRVSPSLQTRRS